MGRKRIVVTAVVAVVLAVLVYLQFRTWTSFEWSKLLQYELRWRHIVHGVALIYLAYILRALRWKIFLRPVRKHASTLGLIPPTLIGFTGLAILGRPGELIRPYLVARRENLSFASQLAVWAVERIFDVGGFTVLMLAAIFLPSKLRAFMALRPAYHHALHVMGYVLVALVGGLLISAMLVAFKGPAIADWVENRFSHLAGNLGHRIAQRVREFAAGLHTIHSPFAFLQLSAVSVLMWWLIAVAYKEVTHAYGAPMHAMSVTKVLLLMGSSMIGSMVQLPGVGGGSQLATIAALDHIFGIPKELAVSCGIMLWLVTFVAVVPIGLALAHRERLSLRKLSQETQKEEEEAALTIDRPLA
ncbi:MAG TPA: lysylphosphatidylglycerol synthase transmembrane domain-containing protein [Terriglobales bacterium]|nr:lysylphosphatidylglycerol synthase transmembrane domain-containing protein [Terriglobales bacterium]